LSAIVAIVIMARINLSITLVTVVPMMAVMALTRAVWVRFLHYYAQTGRAADAVTGFLGEVFGAVQAVKVARTEENVVDHLRALGAHRRQVELRLQLVRSLLTVLAEGSVSVGVGIVLLLTGRAMAAG